MLYVIYIRNQLCALTYVTISQLDPLCGHIQLTSERNLYGHRPTHTEIQQDQRTNVRTRIDADKITKEEGNANDLTLAIQPCLHHKATVHPEKNY